MIRSERRVAQGEKGGVYHLAGADGVLHTVVNFHDMEFSVVLTVGAEFFLSERTEACSGIRVKNQGAPPPSRSSSSNPTPC